MTMGRLLGLARLLKKASLAGAFFVPAIWLAGVSAAPLCAAPGALSYAQVQRVVDGDTLRIYARIYTRDHYVYGYTSADQVPPLDAVFVLSLSGIDERDDVYNQLRDQLGAFVETAVVESDIDIDIDN